LPTVRNIAAPEREQIVEANHGFARLSANDDAIRSNSPVTGGPSKN
jgi:hypothetical protein